MLHRNVDILSDCGLQVGTLLHWCFVERPMTPPKGSTATPGVPDVPPSAFTPRWSFCSPVGAFVLIHSQFLLCSAASASDLTTCRKACPRTPIPLSSLVVDVATNPLNTQSQLEAPRHASHVVLPWLLCRSTSVAYAYMLHQLQLLMVQLIPRCTVTSERLTTILGSGLRLVVMISGGKVSLWSKSTCILQSRAVSRWVASTLADGFAGSCPALTNGVVFVCLGIGGGRALLVVPFPSRVIASCRRTWLCLQV